MKLLRRLLPIIAVLNSLVITGCSLTPAAPDTPLSRCQQQLHKLQQVINQHLTVDAQYQQVEGFPTYRTNRFWSSFEPEALTLDQQDQWRRKLHQLGMDSLEIEWRNLPTDVGKQLGSYEDFQSSCDAVLYEDSLTKPLQTDALQVTDSYNDWLRFFGFYAIIKYAATQSIAEYQDEMRTRINGFETPPGPFNHYHPTRSRSTPPIQRWLQQAYRGNPLALPGLDANQLQSLFAAHAPDFYIKHETDADLPGAAHWISVEGKAERAIDSAHPAVYTYPSYIRFNGAILLQLNYTIWFSERPKPTEDDWYGGKLDGLVWRVTLQPDGQILMYDSIHPCGCYHTVHVPLDSPLHDVIAKLDQSKSLEPILFFDSTLTASQSAVALTLEAGTHYLLNVTAVDAAISAPIQTNNSGNYELLHYDSLRSLPNATSTSRFRNWFDSNGRIKESARRERYFLWPLGVDSAGAMRQQGNHAIAFVGKRHFDAASVERLLNIPNQNRTPKGPR